MAIGTTETTDRNLAVLEAAFSPLETRTSTLETGNVEIRLLDGEQEILVEDRPLYGLNTEKVLQDWITDIRGRLQGMGYELGDWQMPPKEER